MAKYLLFLIPKRPVFCDSQIKVLVDIFVGMGMISTGSVVLPAVLDKWSWEQVVSGLVVTAIFWVSAFMIARRINI